MKKKSRPEFSRATLFAGAISVMGLIGALGYGWLGKPVPEAISPPATPSFVPVVEADFDSSQDGAINAIRLGFSGATVAELSGVVTEVNVTAGQTVSSGDLLFWVNQDPVYALQSDVVFFRDLMQGMSGSDVAALQSFLSEQRGEKVSADGKYGANTTAAVKRWELELGISQSGTVPVGRFATISEDFEVAEITIKAGDAAPAARTVPVREATRYQITSVTGTSGAVPQEDYLFRSSGTELSLHYAEGWQVTDPDRLAELLSAQPEVEGHEFVLPGRLSLARPISALSVPASALLGSQSGGVCAWVEGGTEPILDIHVLGNAPSGAVKVESASLRAGINVMINPAEVQQECP